MNHIKISSFIIIASILISGVILFDRAGAESLDSITFPIEELGGCENESSCRSYCDNLLHIDSCIDFGLKNGLMSEEEAAEARKFAKIGIGPGGCTSKESCEAYCENIDNINECLAFAEENDILSAEELEEAKVVRNAIEKGVNLPGGCTDKSSCETYCEDPSHIDECLLFAEEAGFISPEEIEMAKKFAPLMKEGKTPGSCRSKSECENYCRTGSHFEECLTFGTELGFISPEEAEIMKKTGGKGPGGCTGRESCEAFCNNPQNTEACFAFAKEHGFVKEGEVENFKEGVVRLKEGIENAPPEVLSCIEEQVGAEVVEKIRNGTFTPNFSLGDKIRICFESNFRSNEGSMMRENFENVDPRVRACVEEKLGAGRVPDVAGESQSVASGDSQDSRGIFEACMREFGTPGLNDNYNGGSGQFDGYKGERDGEFRSPEGSGGLPQFSPEIQTCLLGIFGDNFKERLVAGEISPEEMKGGVEKCFGYQTTEQNGIVPIEFRSPESIDGTGTHFEEFNSVPAQFEQYVPKEPIDLMPTYPVPTDGTIYNESGAFAPRASGSLLANMAELLINLFGGRR